MDLTAVIANNFGHLDLLAIAVAVAAIATLGFIVYFSDPKSATNKAFLAFALATIVYGVTNYFSYQATTPGPVLWLLRLTLFTAVWHAYAFYTLFYVFPQSQAQFPWWYFKILGVVVLATSLLTLTPLVFSKINLIESGLVSNPERGPGIAVFGLVAVVLVIGGLAKLVSKSIWGEELQKKQARVVLIGAATTFILILTFNLVLPVFFNILDYIPYASIFFLPFIIFTSHAIRKYRLLNIKILATELFTMALALVSLVEVIFAHDLVILILRLGVFGLVLGFGVLLIRSVIREVQQRERLQTLTEELQTANVKLTQLDKLKSEFLSFASHQIKSPMTVVKGYATLIFDGSYGPVSDKVKETAQKIQLSADRMIKLVATFLDLRRIEEGRMEYVFKEEDLNQLVTSLVDEMQTLAKARGLELHLEAIAKPYRAQIDVQYMRQVLQNLVENAIKYTDKGSVTVSLRDSSSGRVAITISDTGRGIPTDLLPRLFEQFSRDPSVVKEIAGTGLGLYIAKQIVTAHKGSIRATSPGVGQGSAFILEIPVI